MEREEPQIGATPDPLHSLRPSDLTLSTGAHEDDDRDQNHPEGGRYPQA